MNMQNQDGGMKDNDRTMAISHSQAQTQRSNAQQHAVSLVSRVIGHVVVDADLRVVELSSSLADMLNHGDGAITLDAQPLGHVIDTFAGWDDVLIDVLLGRSEPLHIEHVNWTQTSSDGSQLHKYLDFHVHQYPEDLSEPHAPAHTPRLLIVVEDQTPAGKVTQDLMQAKNELSLAQSHLRTAYARMKDSYEQKSMLLSITAHDLRSPLSVIAGYADLLLGIDCQESEAASFVTRITEQVQSLNQLIDLVLDVNAAESGHLTLELVRVDLAGVVDDFVTGLTVSGAFPNLEIGFEAHHATVWCLADTNRIWQLLYNLVDNANKYSRPAGQSSVRIGVYQKTEDLITLSVSDNGPGIAAERIDALFDLYSRGELGNRNPLGWGIGLFVVKSIVEAHAGKIHVESELGRGTTFLIDLPAM